MNSWCPKYIRQADGAIASATAVLRVTTDAGKGYLKALGNPEGPHLLASDLLGTQLADWFELPTFQWSLMEVTSEDELSFPSGKAVVHGPSFITKAEAGRVWGGSVEELKCLTNPSAVARLVVFDTWIRNRDRYRAEPPPPRANLNNVFFSTEGEPVGKARLIAMDHTHCFSDHTELTSRVAQIQTVKDERLYGLFPEFAPLVKRHWLEVTAAVGKLGEWKYESAAPLLAKIPAAWEVGDDTKAALADFLVQRADFLSANICRALQNALDFTPTAFL
jgi:hypothetical protein